MTDSQAPEDIAIYNERSLRTLARAIRFSSGQFSLIIVRCNYFALQQEILQQLEQVCDLKLEKLELRGSEKTLYTTLLTKLGDHQPEALTILGLESVTAIEQMLSSTNQVREEFRKNFSFPLVLWVTDEVFQQLRRLAPDFQSWAATAIKFTISTQELIDLLWQVVTSLFDQFLRDGSDQLGLETLGSRELTCALADLESRNVQLEPTLAACVQFVLGLQAYSSKQLEAALAHYQRSLAFWQSEIARLEAGDSVCSTRSLKSKSFRSDRGFFLERQGMLRYYIGLCYCRQANCQRSQSRELWQTAQENFQQCLIAFEQADRQDLVAQCIGKLGEVLQSLQAWDDLHALAEKALKLHQTADNLVNLAQDYGFLAQVELHWLNWKHAELLAYQALQILEKAPVNQRQHQGLYLLLMARSQRQLGDWQSAIAHLEAAKKVSTPESDPQLFIQILEELRSLYFEQGDYHVAFQLKQAQRTIEHLYGFRAFIGAGQLQPQPREALLNGDAVKLATSSSSPLLNYSLELAVAGRHQDLDRLIQRLGRTDYKLTVIHGSSGVGKSSLVNAGLVPALKQATIGDRIPLPVVLPVYSDWISALERSLWDALTVLGFGNPDSEMNSAHHFSVSSVSSTPSSSLSFEIQPSDFEHHNPKEKVENLLNQMQEAVERNLLPVLIFDQFEEFFFVGRGTENQQLFFQFLQNCLNLPFVKVILSLRTDFLHYLLEFERITNLDVINNNILDKNIRYHLKDFSPDEAKLVIKRLTQRSQFYLEEALINALVRDLTNGLGFVRPIELQVVGAQLQERQGEAETTITTLEQYSQLGPHPKATLVKRSLDNVIQDCGAENQDAAWIVLFSLTDEKGTRPLKSKNELAIALKSHAEKLDLILEIFVGSGLVFVHREAPAERYQLVHDYLVDPIRKEYNLEKRLASSEEEKRLRQVQLERANRKLHRLAVGLGFVALLCASSAIAAAQFWRQAEVQKAKAQMQSKRAEISEANAQISAMSAASEALFVSNKEFDALLESLRAWGELKHKETAGISVQTDTRIRVAAALQQSLYSVREQNRLEGHGETVWSVDFAPDGELIASGSADKTARLWNRDGSLYRELRGHDDSVTRVIFSPNAQLLATASWDKTIKLWRRNGELLHTLTGHSDRVTSLSFSPNNQVIVSGSDDKTIHVWNTAGELIRSWSAHEDGVVWVSFHPNGEFIASAGADETIKIWNLQGRLIKTIKGHIGKVNSVSFSPDGQWLASTSDDKTIKIWSLNGTLTKTLQGHSNWVLAVAWSPDSRWLATASSDNTVKLWELATGTLVKTFQGHSDWVTSLSFSPDGQKLASASYDKSIKLWRLESNTLSRLPHSDRVYSVIFSPDGKLIATASRNNEVKLWTQDGQEKTTLKGHRDRVYSVSFSPDGKLIATASRDCTVKLWQIDGSAIATIIDPNLSSLTNPDSTCGDVMSHNGKVLSVSFSADGKTLASAGSDHQIKLWRTDGKLLKTLSGHTERVNSVSFSPNGQQIASASDDKTVKLWSSDGTLITTLGGTQESEGHQSYVMSVSFSPDGELIASAGWDNSVKIWRQDGTWVKTLLKGYSDSVNSVSFTPDGKILASASWDGTIKLWSVDDGTLLKALQGHKSGVLSISFSPDGKMLASASADNQVILWNLDLDSLLGRACDWLHDYLATNPIIQEQTEDRALCDGVNHHN